MEIVDIPRQIAAALKYSLRSPSSFFLSLFVSVFVLGLSFDLLWGFFYTRILNVKDAHYGPFFWFAIILVAVVIPALYGVVSVLLAKRLEHRAFPETKFGIAIAQFDVYSMDPAILLGASNPAALDAAMQQYFKAAQRAVDDQHWLDDFEFRFLPSYLRIRDKTNAKRLLDALHATLIIWGEIEYPRGDKPPNIIQNMLGIEVDLRQAHSTDYQLLPGTALAFYALVAAGFLSHSRQDVARARKMFSLALQPAAKLDKLVGDGKGNKQVAMVEGFIQQLDGAQRAQASEESASSAASVDEYPQESGNRGLAR